MKNIYICINLLTREKMTVLSIFSPKPIQKFRHPSRRRPTFSTQLERKTKVLLNDNVLTEKGGRSKFYPFISMNRKSGSSRENTGVIPGAMLITLERKQGLNVSGTKRERTRSRSSIVTSNHCECADVHCAPRVHTCRIRL